MKSGVEKAMAFLAAVILGYSWGTMGEQIFQGQLHYAADKSLMIQLSIALVSGLGLFVLMLKSTPTAE